MLYSCLLHVLYSKRGIAHQCRAGARRVPRWGLLVRWGRGQLPVGTAGPLGTPTCISKTRMGQLLARANFACAIAMRIYICECQSASLSQGIKPKSKSAPSYLQAGQGPLPVSSGPCAGSTPAPGCGARASGGRSVLGSLSTRAEHCPNSNQKMLKPRDGGSCIIKNRNFT